MALRALRHMMRCSDIICCFTLLMRRACYSGVIYAPRHGVCRAMRYYVAAAVTQRFECCLLPRCRCRLSLSPPDFHCRHVVFFFSPRLAPRRHASRLPMLLSMLFAAFDATCCQLDYFRRRRRRHASYAAYAAAAMLWLAISFSPLMLDAATASAARCC